MHTFGGIETVIKIQKNYVEFKSIYIYMALFPFKNRVIINLNITFRIFKIYIINELICD